MKWVDWFFVLSPIKKQKNTAPSCVSRRRDHPNRDGRCPWCHYWLPASARPRRVICCAIHVICWTDLCCTYDYPIYYSLTWMPISKIRACKDRRMAEHAHTKLYLFVTIYCEVILIVCVFDFFSFAISCHLARFSRTLCNKTYKLCIPYQIIY